MATASNAIERAQYRTKAARLVGAGRAAMALLSRYSWTDGDGQIHFDVAPVVGQMVDPYQSDLETKQRWSELRAALILSGLLDGVQGVGFLPGGIAQYLRVQTFDKATGQPAPQDFTWQTRAVFEVLTGVPSYGYADGAAADWFYDLGRAFPVRVVLQTCGWGDRAAYEALDQQVVTSSLVVGLINPFESPNLADGWAVIGDLTQNPEPDFFGIQSDRIIIIPTGIEGPQGPRGPSNFELAVGEGFFGDIDDYFDSLVGDQGVPGEVGGVGPVGPVGEVGPVGGQGLRGPRGPIGPEGSGGGVAGPVSIEEGQPHPSDVFAIVRPLRVNRLLGDETLVYMPSYFRCIGGDLADIAQAQAAFESWDLSAYTPNFPQEVDGGGASQTVSDWLYLVAVKTGQILFARTPNVLAAVGVSNRSIARWSFGSVEHPDYGARLVAGQSGNTGAPIDLLIAEATASAGELIDVRGAAELGNSTWLNDFEPVENPVYAYWRWSGEVSVGI